MLGFRTKHQNLQPELEGVKEVSAAKAHSAERLAALVARSDVHIGEILEVVSLDQALADRVLKAANSAASAARMPVKTIKDAIVRLGNSKVLAIATGMNAMEGSPSDRFRQVAM